MNQIKNNEENTNVVLNEFTDDEIREQLQYLGFKNVSKDKFNQFKKDLEKLITQETSINTTNSFSETSQVKVAKHLNLNSRPASARGYSPSSKHTFNELNEKLSRSKHVTFPDDDQNEQDSDQSFNSIVTTSSVVDNNKILKRKIIRKSNQEKSSDFIEDLHSLKNKIISNKFEFKDNNNAIYETRSDNENQYDYDDDDENLIKLNDCYPPINYPMKSVIRSHSSLSLRSDASRNGIKSNPVNKYLEYKKIWNKQKVPGEKSHSDLRWSIREQMLEKHVIIKKQNKVNVPNSYIIPTEKKRQQLRWAVRSALA